MSNFIPTNVDVKKIYIYTYMQSSTRMCRCPSNFLFTLLTSEDLHRRMDFCFLFVCFTIILLSYIDLLADKTI